MEQNNDHLVVDRLQIYVDGVVSVDSKRRAEDLESLARLREKAERLPITGFHSNGQPQLDNAQILASSVLNLVCAPAADRGVEAEAKYLQEAVRRTSNDLRQLTLTASCGRWMQLALERAGAVVGQDLLGKIANTKFGRDCLTLKAHASRDTVRVMEI